MQQTYFAKEQTESLTWRPLPTATQCPRQGIPRPLQARERWPAECSVPITDSPQPEAGPSQVSAHLPTGLAPGSLLSPLPPGTRWPQVTPGGPRWTGEFHSGSECLGPADVPCGETGLAALQSTVFGTWEPASATLTPGGLGCEVKCQSRFCEQTVCETLGRRSPA